MLYRKGRKPVPFDDRLLKIEQTGCLIWTGSRLPTGYGRVRVNNRLFLTHRLAYERAFGPIPEHMYVCHRCDNPACCEPSHLFVGTQTENMADRLAKGRYIGKPGTTNPASKLGEHEVRRIRTLYSDGMRQSDIGAMFSISQRMVSLIVRREKWSHI